MEYCVSGVETNEEVENIFENGNLLLDILLKRRVIE